MIIWSIIPVGLFFLAIGLFGIIYPYKAARLDEQLDAIGSTTPLQDIEPAAWKVTLVRIVSVPVGLGGVVILAMAFRVYIP